MPRHRPTPYRSIGRHPTEASVDTLPKHRSAPYRSIGRHPTEASVGTLPKHRSTPYRSIGRYPTEASVDTPPKHRSTPYRSIGRHPTEASVDTPPKHRSTPYRSIGRDSVAIRSRFCRNRSRFGVLGSSCRCRSTSKTRHKKTRFPTIGNRAARVAMRRALSRRLIPLSNTYASARSVLQGQARQWCIVMPTSARRHTVRYI